jgi:hypothetical protein
MIKKILKWTAIVLASGFIIIQLVRPARTNPATDASRTIQSHIEVPANVDAILKRACNDCHSNETKWPWYSNIAPVSWLVNHDVNEGRRHLNFSEWGSYDERRADKKLDEIEEEVEHGGMPLPIYVSMHPEAKLSDEDRRIIHDWAKGERDRLKGEKEAVDKKEDVEEKKHEEDKDDSGKGKGRGRGRGGRGE